MLRLIEIKLKMWNYEPIAGWAGHSESLRLVAYLAIMENLQIQKLEV